MHTVRVLFACAGMAALSAGAVAAQVVSPFAVEARAGVAVPTGDYADGLNTGFGLNVSGSYRVIPALDLVAGFNWTSFGFSDDPMEEFDEFGDIDASFRDSGFSLGARFFVPVPEGMMQPWVQGGLLLHRLSVHVSGDGGSGSFSGDREVGFEAAAGLGFSVAPNISVTPAVRYRTIDDLNYFGVDVGVRVAF